MKKTCLLLLALFSLAVPGISGERVIPLQTPSKAALLGGTDGIHFGDQDQNVTFMLPKWNGRDQNGNVVPFYKLRKIEVGMILDMNMYATITNTLTTDRSWWKWNVGPYPVLSLDGTKDDGDFIPQKKETIQGLASRTLHAGETLYYPLIVSNLLTFEKYIETPRELRLFTGNGSIPINLILSKYEDKTRVSGHGWSFTNDLVLNEIINEYTPNSPFIPVVKFIWDDSATEFLRSKEIRIQIPEIWFTQDLPYTTVQFDGFNIDPSRIVGGKVTLSPNCWYYDGIENISPNPEICGGYTMFAAELFLNGKWAVNGGVYRGVGSGNLPLPSFDNQADFAGQSGFENWASANSSMPTTQPISITETPWAVCPEDITGANKQLFVTVTANESHYTPMQFFNWWNVSVLSGEVLVRIWYR